MNFLTRLLLFSLLALGSASAAERGTAPAALLPSYDVVIAGAGTGGFGAAVQAARLGATVLLLEETDWIGGQMNAASVTSMDEGPILVRERGIYHEFVEKVVAHYDALGTSAETAYGRRHICMEPRVGQEILYAMLDEARAKTKALHVSLLSKVTAVKKSGQAVTGATLQVDGQPREIACKLLIDATEWGDVLPLAGARYRVGNCTSDSIDFKRAIQDNTWTATVKQYPSGVPAELVVSSPPPGYAAAQPRFAKSLVLGDTPQPSNERPWNFGTFIGYRGMPNSEQPRNPAITRTHLNFNNDYPTTIAEVEKADVRLATNRAAILRTLQLLYYIQHDLRKSDWSVANDEGFDTPYNRAQMDAWIAAQPELAPFRAVLYHFSTIPYVRESRRLIGVKTLAAREIERKPGPPTQFADAVALGDYAIDLHGSKKLELLELDLDRPEDIPHETFGQKGVGPFAIPFGCFVPETLDGFLVAEKNLSQTRLVNGATRLQPSTMLMGQAVGAIAALAVQHGVPPRALDPVLVQRVLLAGGDTLLIVPLKDVGKSSWEWPVAQLMAVRGLITAANGEFAPGQPLAGAAAVQIAFRLGATLPAGLAGKLALSRDEFAAMLQPILVKAHVKLASAPARGDQPVMRLEAARLLDVFLQAKAIADVQKGEQTISWPEPRDPTPLSLADRNPQLAAQLRPLVQRGLIDAPNYWLEHAVAGSECDGARVGDLLRKATLSLRPGTSDADLWTAAQELGLVGSAEYWSKHAVAGQKCKGDFVATILRNIAQKTAAAK